jgi:hypothetical protein
MNENNNTSWFCYIKKVLTHHGLPTNMQTIHTTTKNTWKTMVRNAVTSSANREYFQEAAGSIKMIRGINMVKTAPRLEKYMVELSRKQATAIFRLRARTTKAGADMTSFSNTPVCSRCNAGYESDVHLFTNCTETQEQRDMWSITDLNALYEDDADMHVLRNYARFAIEIGIVPEW